MSRGQQNSTGRLRRASAALGLAAIMASAACSAGQVTQTAAHRPAVNGTMAEAGAIALRDAKLAYPHEGHFSAGDDAPVIAALINTGTEADTLVSASSPVAEAVELTGDTALPGGVSLMAGTPGEDVQAPTTTSAAATSAATTTTSAPAATTSAAVELGKLDIVLTGLKEDLYPGKVYPVTFVFAKAGSITVNLPIAAPSEARVGEEHGGSDH
ncbi:hypothetical protein ACTG9Q_11055 [Actinokineospora sp. 24-640]